jgi:hypothetical protein
MSYYSAECEQARQVAEAELRVVKDAVFVLGTFAATIMAAAEGMTAELERLEDQMQQEREEQIDLP